MATPKSRNFQRHLSRLRVEFPLVMAGSRVSSGFVSLILLRVAELVGFSIEHTVESVLNSAANHFSQMIADGSFIQLDDLCFWCSMALHGSVPPRV